MLRLHKYFGDGAIIQRNKPVSIKGFADKAAEVTLKGGTYLESVIVTPENGAFKAVLPACGDYKSEFLLTVKSGDESVSANVRFGDVYLTMGQSNMSYVLDGLEDPDEWVELAKRTDVSILSIDEKPFTSTEELLRSYDELDDFPLEVKWRKGDDKQIRFTSAISVQLAVLVWQKTGVPTGVIHTATGGLSVDAYIRRKTLLKDEALVERLKKDGRFVDKENWNNCGIRNFSQTSSVWNERIAPLEGISIDGCVWYLGESSALDFSFAQTFKSCLKTLIGDLRLQFGNVKFIEVEIAPEYYPYGDNYGYLYVNEVLQDIAEEVDNVGFVPIYDVEPRWLRTDGADYYHPIHTVNKTLVSKRVSECICGTRPKFPSVASVTPRNGKLYLKIKDAAEGLIGGELNGFAIAAKRGRYYPANAKAVASDEIELYSPDVKNPARATYAFMQYRDFCNARTIGGAPLIAYRKERTSVDDKYYFTPAYLTKGAAEVYENNFGYDVGFCRKVAVFSNGKIYRCNAPLISVKKDGEITLKAKPRLTDYKYFGVSPEINLCGHRNHLADYDFLNFYVKGSGCASFCGVIIKLAGGGIYKYQMKCDGVKVASAALSEQSVQVQCDLSAVYNGAGGELKLNRKQRKNIAELEFLFRSAKKAEVVIGGLRLTDVPQKINAKPQIKRKPKKSARSDITLPTGGDN